MVSSLEVRVSWSLQACWKRRSATNLDGTGGDLEDAGRKTSMASIDFLYKRFDVQPTCSDDEQRRAYHTRLFAVHPDRNQQDSDATLKTQDIVDAFTQLKNYRSQPAPGARGPIKFEFSFSFFSDIRDVVTSRKTRFKEVWEDWQAHPTDPLRALRFIHAAFEAERGSSDILKTLLVDPILIDSASMLLSDAGTQGQATPHATDGVDVGDYADDLARRITITSEARCVTLTRWAEFLWNAGHDQDAIQILEDASSLGLAAPSVTEALRSLHYRAAQYPHPATGAKCKPEARIAHLRRIIALGYNLDYIHKFLAEAYHELGDDEQARASLRQAYEMNPDLSGAVRISHALGFSPNRKAAQVPAASAIRPKWTKPAQVPTPTQIRAWADDRQWASILGVADPADYSRAVLPKARDTLRAIAVALGSCNEAEAIRSLIGLLHFDYYWDVAQAAVVALAKIGHANTLATLKAFSGGRNNGAANWNQTGKEYLRQCISYLQARVDQYSSLVNHDAFRLLARAELESERGNHGLARFLLENVAKGIPRDHPDFADAMVLWARSCAKMNDHDRAIEIIRPMFQTLRERGDKITISDVGNWLWNYVGMEDYSDELDDLYRWALDFDLHLIALATTPEDVLRPLRGITRWLERLGVGDTVIMIRELIRMEAPGTGFVDSHDRRSYVRHVTLSEDMRGFLEAFDVRIKTGAVAKLKDVMGSEPWLSDER
jgi:tetratricopeptide (TPR) repeat protein